MLGWECCSQNTLRATAPSTALVWLLPGTQSSLWLSAGLAVQVWGFWVPGECSAHPFLPPALVPNWGHGTHDAHAVVMPAPWQCQKLSSACPQPRAAEDCTVSLTAPKEHVAAKWGAPRGRTPAVRVPLVSPQRGRVLGVGAAVFPPRPGRPRLWCCGLPTCQGGCWGDLAAGPRCRGESCVRGGWQGLQGLLRMGLSPCWGWLQGDVWAEGEEHQLC